VKAHEIVVHEVNRHHVRVMATVPANELLRRTFMANQDDPRMPAILDDSAWGDWLGETDVTPDQAKALLKTMEGVTWKVAPEPKKPKEAKPPKPEKPKTKKPEPEPGLF